MWSFQWLDTGTGRFDLAPQMKPSSALASTEDDQTSEQRQTRQLSSSSCLTLLSDFLDFRRMYTAHQWCKSGPTWLFFRFLHNKYCLSVAPAAEWTGRSKSRPRRQKLGDRELAIHNTRRSIIAEFLPWHGIYPRRHFPATVGTYGDTCCCHFEKLWGILLWPLSTCPTGGVRKTASKFLPVT